MTSSSRSARLRLVLRVDALASSASGLLLLAGGQPLANLVGIPTGLLTLLLGVILIAYAAALWIIATRPNPPLANPLSPPTACG